MSNLASLWRSHKLLLSAFLVAAATTLFFAIRFAFYVAYWSDPAHRDQPMEGWMTVGYIAHSYQVPREELARVLDLAQTPGKRRTLDQIARERGILLQDLESQIEDAVARLRQEGGGR